MNLIFTLRDRRMREGNVLHCLSTHKWVTSCPGPGDSGEGVKTGPVWSGLPWPSTLIPSALSQIRTSWGYTSQMTLPLSPPWTGSGGIPLLQEYVRRGWCASSVQPGLSCSYSFYTSILTLNSSVMVSFKSLFILIKIITNDCSIVKPKVFQAFN